MIPLEKERQVRQLLSEKVSLREISRRLKVSRDTVRTIMKSPGLRKRKRSPKPLWKLKEAVRCSTCREEINIWPCLWCYPESGDYDDTRPIKRKAPELLSIVQDILELNKLHLIEHPLFLDLARRAKDTITRLGVHNAEEEK